ncbi:MAG: hypothetical protein HFF17_05865 [Oscillospiraceae bacterium]|nr:hypothetical protein [Oscillospiraceae bacterium]
MGKRIEMEATEKEYLIQVCLAGRIRMREAARCSGAGHSTMHTWISRYRAEGISALCENGNAQRRTYSEETRQKAVEEYLDLANIRRHIQVKDLRNIRGSIQGRIVSQSFHHG